MRIAYCQQIEQKDVEHVEQDGVEQGWMRMRGIEAKMVHKTIRCVSC